MKTLLRRGIYELTHDGWAMVHLIVVSVPAWFCFVLALPGATFASSTSFRGLAAIASEPTWAVASGLVAVLGASAWWTRSWPYWMASTVAMSAWHGLVAMCAWQGNPLGTGTGTYAILALATTIKVARPVFDQIQRVRPAQREAGSSPSTSAGTSP